MDGRGRPVCQNPTRSILSISSSKVSHHSLSLAQPNGAIPAPQKATKLRHLRRERTKNPLRATPQYKLSTSLYSDQRVASLW